VEFSFGGGCWVCELCRDGVIKNVHYDCTECSLDVCGSCWKKAAWAVPYDR
jgi:ribosome-binding protein aMBF1 (putative translation factor)